MTLEEQEVRIYDTPDAIQKFKCQCLAYALRWQMNGNDIYELIPRGSTTPLQVLKRDYNFRGRTAEEGYKFALCLLENDAYV
jgi:hypothetical protein